MLQQHRFAHPMCVAVVVARAGRRPLCHGGAQALLGHIGRQVLAGTSREKITTVTVVLMRLMVFRSTDSALFPFCASGSRQPAGCGSLFSLSTGQQVAGVDPLSWARGCRCPAPPLHSSLLVIMLSIAVHAYCVCLLVFWRARCRAFYAFIQTRRKKA